MSRFNVMPRAYRRQLQANDQQAVDRATQAPPDITTGSAGRLRGQCTHHCSSHLPGATDDQDAKCRCRPTLHRRSLAEGSVRTITKARSGTAIA